VSGMFMGLTFTAIVPGWIACRAPALSNGCSGRLNPGSVSRRKLPAFHPDGPFKFESS